MWYVTISEGGRKQAPADAVRELLHLIKGDNISLTGKPEDLRRCRLDTTATPMKFDAYGVPNDKFSKGIYAIDGDTLKVFFGQSTNLLAEGFRYRGTK